MGKRKDDENVINKLLAIPGIKEAIELVFEHTRARAVDQTLNEAQKGVFGKRFRQIVKDDPGTAFDECLGDESVGCYFGDTHDEWLESLATEAGPKIAELWDLSEPAGQRIIDLIYWWGDFLPSMKQSYFLPFAVVANIKKPLLRRELDVKRSELLRDNMAIIDPIDVEDGHIYLDVTYLPSSAINQAYKAILRCRQILGIQKQDLREGRPQSIDTQKALESVRLSDIHKSGKEIANKLGFPIYYDVNPSGSYPLLRKYIKLGREIQLRLEALDSFLDHLQF